MERYAQSDIELRKDYGFRGLAVGAEPVGKLQRANTFRVYAKPMTKWPPIPPSKPVQYEFNTQTRAGLIRVTTNEHSIGKRLLTSLFGIPAVLVSAFKSPPKHQVSGPVFEWSPLASKSETELLYDLVDSGRHDVAQRLNDLIEMFVNDPDVGQLDFASFKSVAEFFKQNSNLRPAIVAGWDGTLAVEWKLPPVNPHSEDQTCGGILGLEFLPNGQIEYLGFVKSVDGGKRIEYDDIAGPDNIMNEISSFLQRM